MLQRSFIDFDVRLISILTHEDNFLSFRAACQSIFKISIICEIWNNKCCIARAKAFYHFRDRFSHEIEKMFMSNNNMIKSFSTIFAIFDHRRAARSWERIRIMWASWICSKHLKNKNSKTKNSNINFTDDENKRLKIRRLIFCDNLTFCSMFSLLRRFNKISCSIKLIKIDQRWWKLISWKRRINDAYFVKKFITNTLSSFSFKTLIALIN